MGLFADLKYAARRLRQRPGLLFTALVTLALGIGFNALVFGWVDSFLLKPLPIAEPDRVVNMTFGEKQEPNVSYLNYVDIRDRNQVFSDVAAERIQPVALSGGIRNVRLWGYEVSGNYFRLMGIQPVRGRLLEPSDDQKTGASPVAVISYGCWLQRFGADPGAVGRTVRVDGHPFTIAGIAPPGFRGTERWYPSDIWIPTSMVRDLDSWDWRESRNVRNMWAIARLKPGIGKARAEASLNVLASQMAREHPDINEGFRLGVAPPGLLGATLRGPFIGMATALLLVSALTLLVACANLSGLVLAHASARQKEIAIRYAIGAGRAAILRMMLAESLLIALGGSVLGFLTGVWMARAIEASKPVFDFPIDTRFAMDWRVAGFAVAVSLASAALFGLLPGLRASRVDLTPALKSGAASGLARHWTLRDVFVGVQVAFCMVLVAGALMMVKTLKSTLGRNFGFNPADAVTLRFDLGMQGYSKERGVEVERRLLERVRAMPGVQAAGLASSLPLSIDSSSAHVSIEGAAVVPFARLPEVYRFRCGPDFFRSFGARIVAGRDFNFQDKEGAPRVAIVNQIFAETLLAGRDPLNSRFRFGASGDWVRIVGVVERGKMQTITEDPTPAVWSPLAQDSVRDLAVVVRSGHADAALLTAVRHAVEELDPDVSIFDAKTLQQHLDVPLTPLRWTTAVLTAMGVVVLFLAALGLYGILSYTTGRQTREIGIRLALGAQPRHVLLPVLARTMTVVSIAAALGMMLSIPATRLLANLLLGEADITAQLSAIAALAAACLLASVVPVRRALLVDPATALRQE
ncbi:MAG: ABC transporter permease [Bryobacteraceae bacterium]